jgi:hypothetical protein
MEVKRGAGAEKEDCHESVHHNERNYIPKAIPLSLLLPAIRTNPLLSLQFQTPDQYLISSPSFFSSKYFVEKTNWYLVLNRYGKI